MSERGQGIRCQYCGGEPGYHMYRCPVIENMTKAMHEQRIQERGETETQDWRTKEMIENLKERSKYYQELLAAQSTPDQFPTSTKIQNPDLGPDTTVAQHRYKAALQEYILKPPDDEKHHWGGNANTGHKLHLNVPLASVRIVSDHLKMLGVQHKYLRGGEVDDGKIFTVYCGSKDRADAIAQQISRDLGSLLRRPMDTSEIEYAPNVVGRFAGAFTGPDAEFGQYPLMGMRGLTVLKSDVRISWTSYKDKSEAGKKLMSTKAFVKAFTRASEKYGTYFYGSSRETKKT